MVSDNIILEVKSIDELTSNEEVAIRELLDISRFSAPFHTVEWNRIIRNVFGERVSIALCFNEFDLVGYFPYHDRRECYCLKRVYSFGSLYENVYGGLIVRDDNPELVRIFLNKLLHKLKLVSYYGIELPPGYPNGLFERFNFHIRYTYDTPVLDLNRSLDEIWKSWDYKKVGWGINKAQKRGVSLTMNKSKDLPVFHRYLRQTYERFGKEALPIQYYEKLFHNGLIQIFSACYNDQPIAVILVSEFHNTIYYWAGSSSCEHRSLCPNDYLIWEIIKWGKKRGCKYFDLLRMSPGERNPNGIRQFKIKFQGEIKPLYYAYKKTHYHYIGKMANYGLSLLGKS